MDGDRHGIARDGNGRFMSGSSGNPAGKKPGTRNRATVLRAALADGEAVGLARVVIDKALAGDAVASRFLLERLEPKPRGRPIQLELPAGESAAGDVVALFNAALRALASGEITPGEAVEVSRFIEGRYRVLRAWQLEEKLTRWNNPLPIPGDDFVPEGTAERVADPLAPSSSPLGERIKVRGSCGVSVLPDDSSHAETPPRPALSPRGEGTMHGGETVSSETEFVIDDDLAMAVRDRLLVIPGVREAARELGLLRRGNLHSACIAAPPASSKSADEGAPERRRDAHQHAEDCGDHDQPPDDAERDDQHGPPPSLATAASAPLSGADRRICLRGIAHDAAE
jgi:hypothetical protein